MKTKEETFNLTWLEELLPNEQFSGGKLEVNEEDEVEENET